MGRIIVSENVSLDGVIQDPTGDEGFNSADGSPRSGTATEKPGPRWNSMK